MNTEKHQHSQSFVPVVNEIARKFARANFSQKF